MSIAMAGIDWELEEHPEHFIDERPIGIKNFDDYRGFSTVVAKSAIDPEILAAAELLGRAFAKEIENELSRIYLPMRTQS
jgi:hypothetical protein